VVGKDLFLKGTSDRHVISSQRIVFSPIPERVFEMDKHELRLRGHVGNYNRSVRIAERAAVACKRSELEKLFATIQARHKKAQADVDRRGEVLVTVRYTANGRKYTIEQPNPFLKIAQRCESQMLLISRQLGKYGMAGQVDANAPKRGTAESEFPELFSEETCPQKN
jgi:hypothetical protein